MPSYGIHLIVLDKAVEKLNAGGYTKQAALLQKHSDFASLGAMGPDIYFFAPDLSQTIADLVDFLFDVYEVLEPFIDFYEDYIEPIENAVDSGIDWLTGGLWDSLKQTINQMYGTVVVLMTRLIINQNDFFQYFNPNMNKGKLEKDWYWIEMGHGRKTGELARNLNRLSQNNDALIAYVCGYLTHIATDVVGHPFVNQITGGPFRTHWHRHHLVENFMDVWTWQHYKNANILESNLHKRMYFGGGSLDRDLISMIDRSFQDTYPKTPSNLIHLPTRLNSHYLSKEQINQTYVLFRKYLELATSRGVMSLPKPQAPQVIPGLSNLFSNPPSSSGGSFSWSALWNWIKWLFEQIFKILTLPIHILAALGTYGVRYMLYLLQMGLYNIYKALREALVMHGYVMCEPGDLTSPYALEYTRQRLPHPSTRMHNPSYPYPLQEYSYTAVFGHQIPYPPMSLEANGTESSPYPVGSTPDIFIDKAVYNPQADGLAFAGQPEETQKIDFDNLQTGKGQLGNAVDWSVNLILKCQQNTLKLNPDLPDWNLDADRGYGWLNWYWEPYNKDRNVNLGLANNIFYFK